MKEPLTYKQQELLGAIRSYFKSHEQSPTLKEMGDLVGGKSLRTVAQYLDILERKGYIFRRKHAKRNIELVEEKPQGINSSFVSVPVAASVGCDDLSVFVNENHDEFLEVDQKLVEGKEPVVAVRAVGNSMNDADIENGDYVLVQVTDVAESGDRVVAIVGDMVTVKRLEKKDGFMILRPESKDPSYKPIILNDDFKIAGKVICTVPGDSMDITRVEPLVKNY
jgi:repressor LexA